MPLGTLWELLGRSWELFGGFWSVFSSFGDGLVNFMYFCVVFSIDLVGFLVRFSWADAEQKLGRSWPDAGQLQTFLNHSEAWSRPREARPKTTRHDN